MTYEQANSYLQRMRHVGRVRQEELFRCVDIVESAGRIHK